MNAFRAALLWSTILVLAGHAPAQSPFTENGGVVDIEAESWSNNIPRGGVTWDTTNAVPGFSGTGYIEANPNIGANISSAWTNTSPEVDYAVNFAHALPHVVWIRGYATNDNDDSVHAGLDGATNTAAGITLSQYNVWQWSTNRAGTFSGVPTLTVGTTGIHTFKLWMREDGMRIDRVILTTNFNFQPILGNCFHIPSNIEVGGLPMRSPVSGMTSNSAVFLYTGNQDAGAGGNPGNQLQTGSTIFYKHLTNATWSSVDMKFYATVANNKYYSNSIPANVFNPGDVVQYYFRIPYSDHLTTFIGGNNTKYEIETDARNNPSAYTILPLAEPSGSSSSYTYGSGSDQVTIQVFTDTGHIRILSQALDGTELGATNTIMPASAVFNGNIYGIGRVLSYTPTITNFVIRQAMGLTSIVAQVSSPSDHVIRYEVTDWGGPAPTATMVDVPSDANEHFYGFGEKFNSVDQAGKLVHMITDDPPGSPKGDRSYKVAPWFISTKGYGFHFDSSAESYFDMRSTVANRYNINNLFGVLKYNYVVGPKLTDVLTRYTAYSGRPKMSPPWAYAPWMSSDIWYNGGNVRYLIEKYRALGIPGSVLVFDSPWEKSYNDFQWNTNQWTTGTNNIEGQAYAGFTTVGDMMTFLRTNGFYVICWMTPFVNTSSNNENIPGQNTGQAGNYAGAALSNYFVRASVAGPPLVTNWWKGVGSPVDYTNPNAALWAQAQLSNLVAQSSSGGFNVIGGFKTDDGESGNPPGSYIPKSAVYFDGRTGQEMQNGYALEYHKTIWNVLGTNGLLFARSGFAGSQAYSGYWAGDNYPNYGQDNGLQSVIVAAGSSAMSGFSTWSSDIGGYQNTSFESDHADLFRRWTQFGAFSPLMQLHRQVNTGNLEQYPWGYGLTALTNYINYAKLHTALFPYVYSYATEASTNGLPIMRPLVLLNQTDPNVYGINHTYMFGNELLVAPVTTAGATSRNLYLPAGAWHDYFTNQRYIGSSNVVWNNSNPLHMPLFVRDGGIVPMISTNVMTLCDAAYVSNPSLPTMTSALEFLIYPAASSSFTVYDGTSLTVQSNNTVISSVLNSTARPITLRFRGGPAASVERDGVRISSFTNINGFVQVTFNHTGGPTQVWFGPDSDLDGIPDSWAQYWFGMPNICASCDSDGDGLSNLEEYTAGTSPTDSANFLRIASIQSGALNFASVTGMLYRVEMIDNIASNVWSTLSNNVAGTGNLIQINDPGAAGATQRFYRVRLLP